MATGPEELKKILTDLKDHALTFDEKVKSRLDDVCGDLDHLRKRYNELAIKVGRPTWGAPAEVESAREQALGLIEAKRAMHIVKADVRALPAMPSEPQVEEALHAIAGLRSMMKTVGLDGLPEIERKALTAFNVGDGFLLAPEQSSQILSCLTDPTDISGLVNNVTIAAPAIRFNVDNELIEPEWSCNDCYSSGSNPNFGQGLGTLEIRAESLRYSVCAGRDLIEDAAAPAELWLIQKANRAFRSAVSNAIVAGDGIGKPQGILTPAAGIPICDTGAATPAGIFTWQDLVALRWQVPQAFQGTDNAYLMNQNTFSQVLTMSDAIGRPIMLPSPTVAGQFLIAGSPVVIASQMPDVAPGTTPVAFGNWKSAYTLATRRAVTMLQEVAGWCIIFRFEARVGGAITCPLAARLLRIN